jgi:hypothetical protein
LKFQFFKNLETLKLTIHRHDSSNSYIENLCSLTTLKKLEISDLSLQLDMKAFQKLESLNIPIKIEASSFAPSNFQKKPLVISRVCNKYGSSERLSYQTDNVQITAWSPGYSNNDFKEVKMLFISFDLFSAEEICNLVKNSKIESLDLCNLSKISNLCIQSKSLKKLHIHQCKNLVSVEVDCGVLEFCSIKNCKKVELKCDSVKSCSFSNVESISAKCSITFLSCDVHTQEQTNFVIDKMKKVKHLHLCVNNDKLLKQIMDEIPNCACEHLEKFQLNTTATEVYITSNTLQFISLDKTKKLRLKCPNLHTVTFTAPCNVVRFYHTN